MPEPKPSLRPSTPAPVAKAPAPAPDSKCPVLRGADRRAPLAEQEAKLACGTPALAGQPKNTARNQAVEATRATRKAPLASSRAEDQQRVVSGIQLGLADAAERASSYHILLKEWESNPCEVRDAQEARWDAGAYRSAEAGVATVGPLWCGATAVAQVSDIRFGAAMGALAQAGLMREDERAPDEDKIGLESRAFVEGAGDAVIKPISVDGGGIKLAMMQIEKPAHDLNAAVAEQRAHYLSQQSEDAAAAARGVGGRAKEGLGLLADLTSFVGKAGAFAAAPSPATGIALADGAVDLASLLTSSQTLAKRAEGFAAQAEDAVERARWYGFVSAIQGLTNACMALREKLGRLDQETASCSADLHGLGRQSDDKSGATEMGIESRAAIGLHMGKIIEAQRFNTAALDAWRAVESPTAAAQAAAAVAVVSPRTNWQLRAIQVDARSAALSLGEVAAFRNAMTARYAERQASLVGACKTVVSSLSGLAEDRGAQ